MAASENENWYQENRLERFVTALTREAMTIAEWATITAAIAYVGKAFNVVLAAVVSITLTVLLSLYVVNAVFSAVMSSTKRPSFPVLILKLLAAGVVGVSLSIGVQNLVTSIVNSQDATRQREQIPQGDRESSRNQGLPPTDTASPKPVGSRPS